MQNRNRIDFLIAVGTLILVLFVAGVIYAAPDVAVRRGGRVLLVANTPATVGPDPQGRVELQFKNEGANNIFCGYIPGSLNCTTPGPDAGAKYTTGQGVIRCVFPDRPLYCLDCSGGSEVSFDEAYMRTATATATATATPTPT